MADYDSDPTAAFDTAARQMGELMQRQAEATQGFFAAMTGGQMPAMPAAMEFPVPGAAAGQPDWAALGRQLQAMWGDYRAMAPGSFDMGSLNMAKVNPAQPFADPARFQRFFDDWWKQMPIADPGRQQELVNESVKLWQDVLGQFTGGMAALAGDEEPDLPRKDRRFADPKWRQQPMFALIHQTYLMLAERIGAMVDEVEGLTPEQRDKLRFSTRTVLEALSPDHFPLTNPLVLERTMQTGGQNLMKGMEHLIADLKKGQLTHVDPEAFEVGRNIATTPGKVVHETPLYQLIQYSPTTDKVLETPLVIFPPWINRFYILDLNEKKSFVRWAVGQGISTFMVSWKSADETLAEVTWDDYIAAQIDAIDHIRERLGVKDVHTIGYCVAGTTLAATLSVLEAKGEAEKVKSATFFTAQVDFEKAGELKVFIDDAGLDALKQSAPDGYVDGRVMAATFNMLRGTDLIWNYVVNNYLMGEDYPAFDLLHWNGDVTNLPAKWHQQYLRELYRDNLLVKPGAVSALGEKIDLTKVTTPSYVQAGREDHIASAESVFRVTDHFAGPVTFMLAGSGHIAGVVNPPGSGKYQYWTNDGEYGSFAEFVDGAQEHPGSWWPHWHQWLLSHGKKTVEAKGKRAPGGWNDQVLEDAPGRYVKAR
ncbi:class I poly(R)-hydroxyalkanoic acid synthase [Alteriqipengyuania flavescens]|uniref:PHA/PHB synthase family protein n=1 Tax=Alteriqipengyuania flavescens TaxID=3053610 RepID=UPI0025B2D0A6|nr:class I poly(R)-hydroxyalkanoic acid synthase [Alteriqipengyuania flavescens]WJY17528.1 class I poly(R)-hydroxyalkanoic acid synthase [Alteriqipengyuania flavescens]WJY23471.1 class I poly(R)-hydroxyalkanoic acid synthase [Alteriqipengyuania flavescens]